MTAGAIPFLALAPPIAQSLPFLPTDLVANAALLQLGYGASIASFLGGIHWAMAMAEYGGKIPFTLPSGICSAACCSIKRGIFLLKICVGHSNWHPGEGYLGSPAY